MTRKLPADMPSPEERGAHRPDEPEKGISVEYGPAPISYNGPFGVTSEHPSMIPSLAWAEAERRILMLESMVAALQEVVQP